MNGIFKKKKAGNKFLPRWRRDAGAIMSIVNARDLQLDCTRVLREIMLIPVLMYGSEKMLRLKC